MLALGKLYKSPLSLVEPAGLECYRKQFESRYFSELAFCITIFKADKKLLFKI